MDWRLIPLWLVAICVGCGGAEKATKGRSMGPLSGRLESWDVAPWTSAVAADGFRLANGGAADEIKFYFIHPQRSPNRAVEYAVDVRLDKAGANAAVGLFFGIDPQQEVYYVFVARSDDIAVLKRSKSGFQVLASTSSNEYQADRPTELVIREQGRGAEFRANGEVVFSITDVMMPERATGIVAIGQGEFFFADFRSPPVAAGDKRQNGAIPPRK